MIQFAPAAILIVSGTTNIFTSYKPSSIISSLIHFHIRRTFGISLNNVFCIQPHMKLLTELSVLYGIKLNYWKFSSKSQECWCHK